MSVHDPSPAALTMVRALDLEPHPEGGWFRRTWTPTTRVATPGGERATASAILFLLDADEEAVWHKVVSDELWLWHGPGDLEIHLGGTGEAPVEDPHPVVLHGGDAARSTAGEPEAVPCAQVLVPAGHWQRTFARRGPALASCIVSPEFTYDDWSLAQGLSPRAEV